MDRNNLAFAHFGSLFVSDGGHFAFTTYLGESPPGTTLSLRFSYWTVPRRVVTLWVSRTHATGEYIVQASKRIAAR